MSFRDGPERLISMLYPLGSAMVSGITTCVVLAADGLKLSASWKFHSVERASIPNVTLIPRR